MVKCLMANLFLFLLLTIFISVSCSKYKASTVSNIMLNQRFMYIFFPDKIYSL